MQSKLDLQASTLDFNYERPYWEEGQLVAGVDEVGRGPLAGPVVAGCCVFSPDLQEDAFSWARDSKRLTHTVIEKRGQQIRQEEFRDQGLLTATLGAASVREIDHKGIQQATILAMKRSLQRADRQLQREGRQDPDKKLAALVDGRDVSLGRPSQALVGGDDLSPSIACGSIIAKYIRDLLMERLAKQHPRFSCWASDRGYASPKHLEALQEHGPIAGHHRLSFKPCNQLALF